MCIPAPFYTINKRLDPNHSKSLILEQAYLGCPASLLLKRPNPADLFQVEGLPRYSSSLDRDQGLWMKSPLQGDKKRPKPAEFGLRGEGSAAIESN